MSGIARGAGETGAQNIWSGTIPANLPYRESYYVRETDGTYMEFDNLTIKILFRECVDNSSVLTLSTEDDTIIVEDLTDDDGNTIPTFRPDDASVTALSGDYFADIVMTDADDVDHYWAAGIITFATHPASGV
jgi:hypothetical protein